MLSCAQCETEQPQGCSVLHWLQQPMGIVVAVGDQLGTLAMPPSNQPYQCDLVIKTLYWDLEDMGSTPGSAIDLYASDSPSVK